MAEDVDTDNNAQEINKCNFGTDIVTMVTSSCACPDERSETQGHSLVPHTAIELLSKRKYIVVMAVIL